MHKIAMANNRGPVENGGNARGNLSAWRRFALLAVAIAILVGCQPAADNPTPTQTAIASGEVDSGDTSPTDQSTVETPTVLPTATPLAEPTATSPPTATPLPTPDTEATAAAELQTTLAAINATLESFELGPDAVAIELDENTGTRVAVNSLGKKLAWEQTSQDIATSQDTTVWVPREYQDKPYVVYNQELIFIPDNAPQNIKDYIANNTAEFTLINDKVVIQVGTVQLATLEQNENGEWEVILRGETNNTWFVDQLEHIRKAGYEVVESVSTDGALSVTFAMDEGEVGHYDRVDHRLDDLSNYPQNAIQERKTEYGVSGPNLVLPNISIHNLETGEIDTLAELPVTQVVMIATSQNPDVHPGIELRYQRGLDASGGYQYDIAYNPQTGVIYVVNMAGSQHTANRHQNTPSGYIQNLWALLRYDQIDHTVTLPSGKKSLDVATANALFDTFDGTLYDIVNDYITNPAIEWIPTSPPSSSNHQTVAQELTQQTLAKFGDRFPHRARA